MRVAPGEVVGLVGPSGSGKSTLIGLVMAFHRPQEGTVVVDGKDLTGLRLRDYRHFLGVVMQDNFLFDGTIRENIAFAFPGATDEEIREAARIAHCDEFIQRFDDGYDTVVGERGVKLSGGQRQRVGIARAILADPRVLILDDATSAVDPTKEHEIRDAMDEVMDGRTTLVIAHRPATIALADRVVLMRDGRIVQAGPPAELYEDPADRFAQRDGFAGIQYRHRIKQSGAAYINRQHAGFVVTGHQSIP